MSKNTTPKLSFNKEEVACLESIIEEHIEMIESEANSIEELEIELREDLKEFHDIHYKMLKFFRVVKAYEYQVAK